MSEERFLDEVVDWAMRASPYVDFDVIKIKKSSRRKNPHKFAVVHLRLEDGSITTRSGRVNKHGKVLFRYSGIEFVCAPTNLDISTKK